MAVTGTPVMVVSAPDAFPVKQVLSTADIPVPFATVVTAPDAVPIQLHDEGLPMILLDTAGVDYVP